MEFDPEAYGPVAAELLQTEHIAELGPGSENAAARDLLESATVDRLFVDSEVKDSAMAEACCSGLWLYHDYLDKSHRISQSISTPTGSYWHGIMHRREPDFSNSKYWFRRVGKHPVFGQLARTAREIAAGSSGLREGEWLADGATWNPMRFVDLCEFCCGNKGPDQTACRLVGLAEWRLLFDFSYRKATGQP